MLKVDDIFQMWPNNLLLETEQISVIKPGWWAEVASLSQAWMRVGRSEKPAKKTLPSASHSVHRPWTDAQMCSEVVQIAPRT